MSNKPDPARAAELAAILAHKYPYCRPVMVARVIVEAVKLARYAKSRAELECSYPMTEENINRAARRMERAAAKVNHDLASAIYGAELSRHDAETAINTPRCEFGGDPRGCCGKLVVPGMDGDGWGRDGFPLY